MQLSEYVSRRGAVSELADKLGIAHSMVSRWARGKRRVPATRAQDIEAATDGAVTCQEMRPDVFKNGRSLVPSRQKSSRKY